jgi:hypothetical protein
LFFGVEHLAEGRCSDEIDYAILDREWRAATGGRSGAD